MTSEQKLIIRKNMVKLTLAQSALETAKTDGEFEKCLILRDAQYLEFTKVIREMLAESYNAGYQYLAKQF